jgi:hypothetical protein
MLVPINGLTTQARWLQHCALCARRRKAIDRRLQLADLLVDVQTVVLLLRDQHHRGMIELRRPLITTAASLAT